MFSKNCSRDMVRGLEGLFSLMSVPFVSDPFNFLRTVRNRAFAEVVAKNEAFF